MKIKQIPHDFVVNEIGSWTPDPNGVYSIYRLAKRGIGTLEAVDVVSRTLGVSRKRISFGGLKDRHSESEQMISIRHGAPADSDYLQFGLRFLGRSAHPIDRKSFTANHFSITIRDLTPDQAARIQERLAVVRTHGIPNYFDDQRFGSLRGSGEFIARKLIAGDFESALKLAIASPSAEDQKTPRAIKKTIRDHWGRWAECKQALPRCSERSIVTYLVDHPASFARAYELISKNLRILYLSAYQSCLWNRSLSHLLREQLSPDHGFPYSFVIGELMLYHTLPPASLSYLSSLSISLITRTSHPEDEVVRPIVQRVLDEEGISRHDLRLKGLKKAFFSKGERKAIVFPGRLTVPPPSEDDLNRGKQKLTLSFELPKGSYATILIKRLTYDMELRRRENT